MLGSHQLSGSRCAIVLLRQEWGWEESSVGVSFGVCAWGLSPSALGLLVATSGLKLVVWVSQVIADSILAWFSSCF